MKLNRKALNESGIAHLLLLVVVVVAIGGVGTLVAVRQSKARNDSKTTAQAPVGQQDARANQSTQKTEATPVTQAADPSTPAATPAPAPTASQAQTAPKPAAPKITHPTDASCPGEGKTITVYASVAGGTPVYKQNYAAPELLAKKLDYGASVAVSCYSGWVTYRVGDQPYYMNYADVSVTKP